MGGSFYYRTEQAAFDAAFSGLTAEQAAELILGRRQLSAEQADALRYAEGNGGYGLRFDPAPVGHMAFATAGTRGTGNGGWHLLVPATPECRRLVNAARREEFARRMGAPRPVADRVFSEAHGYEPALQAAADVWPLLSRCPAMTNRALREAGFRPGHSHEGAGIAAVRVALGVAA
jgi:hypothetical protein